MDADLMVIGGGAAGFFGAIACAEEAAAAEQRILILEKGSALLAKVLVSGGGRCNLTHACFDPALLVGYYPRGGRELRGAFSRFQPRDTQAWFERHGVSLKTEADGRMFPRSDRAQTVADCLIQAAAGLGISIRKNSPVVSLRRDEAGFEVELRGGETLRARAVLLASGGERGGYALAQSLGHTILPLAPSLFTFGIQDARIAGLAGVSVADALLSLPEAGLSQRGPLLITHWGLSGPAALRLSAWGARYLNERAYQAPLEIQWLAGQSTADIAQQLAACKEKNGRRPVGTSSAFAALPQRLWRQLCAALGVEEKNWADLKRGELQALADELAAGRFRIQTKGEFKEEFVTCGGVALNEVDFRRMESKRAGGLFLAGEVLDIDGVTGGFNFQAAWTTGWIAGVHAARFLAGS